MTFFKRFLSCYTRFLEHRLRGTPIGVCPVYSVCSTVGQHRGHARYHQLRDALCRERTRKSGKVLRSLRSSVGPVRIAAKPAIGRVSINKDYLS